MNLSVTPTSAVSELAPTPKKGWVAPAIKPITMGSLNKFGNRNHEALGYVDQLEGHAIDALFERYGSPLFVTSETRLRQNQQRLLQAFESRYPKVVHGWSYKTNYTSALCQILHEEGSWAEVVSAFEYEKARHLGVPGNRIIYNGPHKTPASLKQAIAEGARIHLDNFQELERVAELAQAAGSVACVALRLNFDTGFSDPWSRFGFNLETGEALEAVHQILAHPSLKLVGLHNHIGTFVLDTRAYQAQVRILCEFMERIEREFDLALEYLDIGGGFASQNALQGIYLPPEQVVPSFDTYAEAICSTLVACLEFRSQQGRPLPLLILETGRAVVDDAQVLLTRVQASKTLPDGRASAVLDAGVNILFTGFWYHHKIQLTQPVRGYPEDTVLYGPLCMNIDVVRQSVSLPPLQPGDGLMISPVGAYNNTQWMQFIEYRPAIVLLHADGERCSVIRRAEDLASMIAHDVVPQDLGQALVESLG